MTLLTRFIACIVLLGACASCSRGPQPPAYTPGLGEIMTLTQMRHAKLWFAGSESNWPLAAYELDELHEGLADAGTFHPTHKDAPLGIPALIEKITRDPLEQLQKAVDAKNQTAFVPAFDALSESCNACHRATNFGFNVVTRPSANTFANQIFAPPR